MIDGKKIAEREEKLINYEGDDRVVPFGLVKAELDETKVPQFKVLSEMSTLDNLVDGFLPGELIVVSGRPKSGKTLLLETFTYKFEQQEMPPLWFSYEVPPRQFLSQFINGLPGAYMPRRLELADIKWLEERIWESILKYKTKIVMIDHLHYLVDMSRMKNSSLEIGTVFRKLKLIAIKFNIIIFLICHIGKIPIDREPEGEDIRDSSFALQEPDTVLMLWRLFDDIENGQYNEACLKVVMTRRTGVLSKIVHIQKHNGLLVEVGKNEA